jgi:aminopeptidase N
MESSGIVFLDAALLDDAYTVAHEVAHEWFHWLVANDQLREPWLDEAFATYLAGGLMPRHADGFCSELAVNNPVWRFESADPKITWQRCDDYMETIYYKGSWLVHTVRLAMGDAAFLASLAEYMASYRFAVATTADIVEIWRDHSDAVTDELLEPWLDLRQRTAGPRHPVYPPARWASSTSS